MKKVKIPYGLSDYREIRTEDYVYVDKTRYIEELEALDTKYPVFLRPRRFGKSLFVSTLFYYYDINSVEDFDLLFEDTYIGRNRTERASHYYVLRLEFSGLETADEQQLREDFYSKVEAALIDFVEYYNLDIEVQSNDSSNAARLLNYFLTACRKKIGKQLYVMIDEYDHFANNVVGNKEFFRSITGRDGFVRSFYEVFKAHTGNGCVDRIFITGVTSMTLDSLTSGFNIATNVSMYGELNEMIGFTDQEVLNLLVDIDVKEQDRVIELLTEYYNGYRFSSEKVETTIYNSNLVLYFLKNYKRVGEIPQVLIDSNIRSDYQKLTRMFELFSDEMTRSEVLEEIMEGKSISANIVTDFTFASDFTKNEFLSMLFYLGLLTVDESGSAYQVTLKVPNAVIRDVYYTYYTRFLQIDENKRIDLCNCKR